MLSHSASMLLKTYCVKILTIEFICSYLYFATDPHFKTYDGTKYSFHGQCDLVMARSSTFGDGAGLALHARTEIVPAGTWSLIKSAALRIGDDIFEFTNDGSYYFNGKKDVELPVMMAGRYTITKSENTIDFQTKSGEVQPERKLFFTIDLGNRENIKMNLFKKMIAVKVGAFLEDTEGMLGIRGKSGMIGRDGESFYNDPNAMGLQWQVKDTEPMLFGAVQAPQYPETCHLPSVKSRRLRVSNILMQEAEEACQSVDTGMRSFCVDDVIATGDIHVASAYNGEDGMSF